MSSPRNLMRIALLVALMFGVLWTLASPRRQPPAASQKRSCQADSPATCKAPVAPIARTLSAA